jgi:hypothetical protein
MRSDWTLTRLESTLFILAATLVASGFLWATGSIG